MKKLKETYRATLSPIGMGILNSNRWMVIACSGIVYEVKEKDGKVSVEIGGHTFYPPVWQSYDTVVERLVISETVCVVVDGKIAEVGSSLNGSGRPYFRYMWDDEVVVCSTVEELVEKLKHEQ